MWKEEIRANIIEVIVFLLAPSGPSHLPYLCSRLCGGHCLVPCPVVRLELSNHPPSLGSPISVRSHDQKSFFWNPWWNSFIRGFAAPHQTETLLETRLKRGCVWMCLCVCAWLYGFCVCVGGRGDTFHPHRRRADALKTPTRAWVLDLKKVPAADVLPHSKAEAKVCISHRELYSC